MSQAVAPCLSAESPRAKVDLSKIDWEAPATFETMAATVAGQALDHEDPERATAIIAGARLDAGPTVSSPSGSRTPTPEGDEQPFVPLWIPPLLAEVARRGIEQIGPEAWRDASLAGVDAPRSRTIALLKEWLDGGSPPRTTR